MDRRAFVATIAGGVAAASRVALAQQPAKIPRIGFLGAESASGYASNVEALRAGLRDLGYVEGKSIAIEYRWAEGKYDRLPDLAGELARLRVAVIVTHGTPGTIAAKRATTTIPIVMATVGDPVATGLVASLARPGGNVTGSIALGPELMAKRLELLKEAVPRTTRVAVLVNPDNPARASDLSRMEVSAGSFHVRLQQFEVRGPHEFENAFSAMAKSRMDAVVIQQDGKLSANLRAIADLAAKRRFPSTGIMEFAEAGGMIGYGANLLEMYRRAAYFVDKILKGANPGNLPVEQATKFQLAINLKSAKALGLTIPQSLLRRADEIIQ